MRKNNLVKHTIFLIGKFSAGGNRIRKLSYFPDLIDQGIDNYRSNTEFLTRQDFAILSQDVIIEKRYEQSRPHCPHDTQCRRIVVSSQKRRDENIRIDESVNHTVIFSVAIRRTLRSRRQSAISDSLSLSVKPLAAACARAMSISDSNDFFFNSAAGKTVSNGSPPTIKVRLKNIRIAVERSIPMAS